MLATRPPRFRAMSRRRSEKPTRHPRPEPFHAPFTGLARTLRTALPTATPTAARAKPRGTAGKRAAEVPRDRRPDEVDEHALFAREMADVRRLERGARVEAPRPTAAWRPAAAGEDAEALAALSDLVSGAGEFDVSDSTEYVEGAVVGLDARILRRLRRGEFAYQAILDLHGMSAAAARSAVAQTIARAAAAGHRAVLIVHGRGRNSRDNVPVLKQRLKVWLAHGSIGRSVLAFTSARPADGGTGALYVLLRRRRGVKERIAVLEGAKRE
jgi:DNA-nicking Smr family endonuclease